VGSRARKDTGRSSTLFLGKAPVRVSTRQRVVFQSNLDRCRSDKPRLVRGGIIAEEMGKCSTRIVDECYKIDIHGLTPFSSFLPYLQASARRSSRLLSSWRILLQIFLSRAVPSALSPHPLLRRLPGALPTAGDSTSVWDKELYARTSEANKKRGSIISRGTLVVVSCVLCRILNTTCIGILILSLFRPQCHVSLVGQWIDEAKSKLKDPGLVYPYHGQSRKRDAAILAKNAIVVTTYQTLASDASYHAKKHGALYCAPCEQVRWWRIICDESHSLREANTQKSAAVMNLVADHKWLVSGKSRSQLPDKLGLPASHNFCVYSWGRHSGQHYLQRLEEPAQICRPGGCRRALSCFQAHRLLPHGRSKWPRAYTDRIFL
jgi:hypothetical protein